MLNDPIRENFINVLKSVCEEVVISSADEYNPACFILLDEFKRDPYTCLHEFTNYSDKIDFGECKGINLNRDIGSIVKEKYGYGFSIKVKGSEYRYVSDMRSPEGLMREFNERVRKDEGEALNWLNCIAITYYKAYSNDFHKTKIVGR